MAATAARTARRAWVPVLIPGDDDIMRTKFGGKPYIPQGREWPLCPVSGEPLLFLCQLVARDSPLATDDPDTMLQFFARADATAVRDDIHGNVLARAVRAPDRYPAPPNAVIPRAATLLESATVLRWDEHSDYPDREELEFASALAADGSGVGDACAECLHPISGIKVGGWPYWVRVTPGSLAHRLLPPLALCCLSLPAGRTQIQACQRPHCDECGRELDIVFLQLDSHDPVFRGCFGDGGIAHIFQCRDHPKHFQLHWQCM